MAERATTAMLDMDRTLPNGIAFGATVTPDTSQRARWSCWLKNGTDKARPACGHRSARCCTQLTAFAQTADEQGASTAVCRVPVGRRPAVDHHRVDAAAIARGQPAGPLHACRPAFPDCPPGETVRARGRLWFYEGDRLDDELKRLDDTGWRQR